MEVLEVLVLVVMVLLMPWVRVLVFLQQVLLTETRRRLEGSLFVVICRRRDVN